MSGNKRVHRKYIITPRLVESHLAVTTVEADKFNRYSAVQFLVNLIASHFCNVLLGKTNHTRHYYTSHASLLLF
jgi:hypothetical protein